MRWKTLPMQRQVRSGRRYLDRSNVVARLFQPSAAVFGASCYGPKSESHVRVKEKAEGGCWNVKNRQRPHVVGARFTT